MIAASARMSGTSVPLSSSLYRGCCASFSSRARTAARARARRARRVLALDFVDFFLRVGLGFDAELGVPAEAVSIGAAPFSVANPNTATAVSKQLSRHNLSSWVLITRKPF